MVFYKKKSKLFFIATYDEFASLMLTGKRNKREIQLVTINKTNEMLKLILHSHISLKPLRIDFTNKHPKNCRKYIFRTNSPQKRNILKILHKTRNE